MITVTIDGKQTQIEEGKTILDAAGKLGIEIPTLCYHDGIEPYGACRICTVEVTQGGRTRLQAACSYSVEDGLDIKTDTERVRKGRKMMAELLLARCPDVKIIQNLAKSLGLTKTRFRLKNDDCFLCGLCVRVCHEVVGAGAIGFSGRGIIRQVERPFQRDYPACIACGACTFVCPTGKVQMEAYTITQLMKLPANERICRYSKMGMFSYKLCPNNYNCYKCDVDQRMEEQFGTHPIFAVRPAEQKETEQIGEFILDPNRYYFHGHVWLKPLNVKIRMGIDDFARRLIGSVSDIIVIPGIDCRKGDIAWEIVSSNKKAWMILPVSGEMMEINDDILKDPSLIIKDCYGRGWVADMKPVNFELESKGLLRRFGAKNWLIAENERLHRVFEEQEGVALTEGGMLRSDLPKVLNDEQWNELTKQFFLVR